MLELGSPRLVLQGRFRCKRSPHSAPRGRRVAELARHARRPPRGTRDSAPSRCGCAVTCATADLDPPTHPGSTEPRRVGRQWAERVDRAVVGGRRHPPPPLRMLVQSRARREAGPCSGACKRDEPRCRPPVWTDPAPVARSCRWSPPPLTVAADAGAGGVGDRSPVSRPSHPPPLPAACSWAGRPAAAGVGA